MLDQQTEFMRMSDKPKPIFQDRNVVGSENSSFYHPAPRKRIMPPNSALVADNNVKKKKRFKSAADLGLELDKTFK